MTHFLFDFLTIRSSIKKNSKNMNLYNLTSAIGREKKDFNMSIEESLINPITGFTGITDRQENPPSPSLKTPYCWISKKDGVIEKITFYSEQFTRKDPSNGDTTYKNMVVLKSNQNGTYEVTAMVKDTGLPHRKIIHGLSVAEKDDLTELSNKLASLKKFLIENTYAEKLVAV